MIFISFHNPFTVSHLQIFTVKCWGEFKQLTCTTGLDELLRCEANGWERNYHLAIHQPSLVVVQALDLHLKCFLSFWVAKEVSKSHSHRESQLPSPKKIYFYMGLTIPLFRSKQTPTYSSKVCLGVFTRCICRETTRHGNEVIAPGTDWEFFGAMSVSGAIPNRKITHICRHQLTNLRNISDRFSTATYYSIGFQHTNPI